MTTLNACVHSFVTTNDSNSQHGVAPEPETTAYQPSRTAYLQASQLSSWWLDALCYDSAILAHTTGVQTPTWPMPKVAHWPQCRLQHGASDGDDQCCVKIDSHD